MSIDSETLDRWLEMLRIGRKKDNSKLDDLAGEMEQAWIEAIRQQTRESA